MFPFLTTARCCRICRFVLAMFTRALSPKHAETPFQCFLLGHQRHSCTLCLTSPLARPRKLLLPVVAVVLAAARCCCCYCIALSHRRAKATRAKRRRGRRWGSVLLVLAGEPLWVELTRETRDKRLETRTMYHLSYLRCFLRIRSRTSSKGQCPSGIPCRSSCMQRVGFEHCFSSPTLQTINGHATNPFFSPEIQIPRNTRVDRVDSIR